MAGVPKTASQSRRKNLTSRQGKKRREKNMKSKLLMMLVIASTCVLTCCSNSKSKKDTQQEKEKVVDIKGVAVYDSVEHFIAQINKIGEVIDVQKRNNFYRYYFKKPDNVSQPYISSIAIFHYKGQVEKIYAFYENTSTKSLETMIKKKYGVEENYGIPKIGKTTITTDVNGISGQTLICYENDDVVWKHKIDEEKKEEKRLEGNI